MEKSVSGVKQGTEILIQKEPASVSELESQCNARSAYMDQASSTGSVRSDSELLNIARKYGKEKVYARIKFVPEYLWVYDGEMAKGFATHVGIEWEDGPLWISCWNRCRRCIKDGLELRRCTDGNNLRKILFGKVSVCEIQCCFLAECGKTNIDTAVT